MKDGRFSTSYLPGGIYAEIREASVCRNQIMKQHVRLSNQIQKLAGLEIVKKSSGKKKGQPRISKRGRRKLRRTMYESARALTCKAIRIFYVVLQTGCEFDEERFRRDIIRPEVA